MRVSALVVAAASPLLASAQQEPLGSLTAQFRSLVDGLTARLPNPGTHDPVAALEAKLGSMRLSTLTLENWRQTLYEPVAPGATVPEEWWVLVSGGNKTCFGRCGNVEKAFNETAARFALVPGSPHMAYLNCDDQPILCNSWAAGAAYLWSFSMLPAPAPVDVYRRRLNLTTTTTDDVVALRAADAKDGWTLVDSWFHPFNGKATHLGLSVPYGYIIWAFNLVPNWLFMLVVSFATRSMMSNRMHSMTGQQRRAGAGPGPAPASQKS